MYRITNNTPIKTERLPSQSRQHCLQITATEHQEVAPPPYSRVITTRFTEIPRGVVRASNHPLPIDHLPKHKGALTLEMIGCSLRSQGQWTSHTTTSNGLLTLVSPCSVRVDR